MKFEEFMRKEFGPDWQRVVTDGTMDFYRRLYDAGFMFAMERNAELLRLKKLMSG